MCGIAGVRRFGKAPITGEELVILLCALEHRGQHATGMALVDPKGIKVLKAPLPAWRFTKDPDFKKFLEETLNADTYIALLHTRWATVGNPEYNKNNHPMWDGETALVHNGSINNGGYVCDNDKLTKTCDTDSDVLRGLVERYGINEKGIRELNRLSGSAAIACATTKQPGQLLIARSGSPLVYGFDEEADKMYWASEPQAILKAAKPYKQIRGVWTQDTKKNIVIGSMPDNTAWIFDENGQTLHAEFKLCTHYRQPDYSKGRENYHSKTRNWKRDAKAAKKAAETKPVVHVPAEKGVVVVTKPELGAVIKCPGCGSGVINKQGRAWEELQCCKCKTALG